MKMKNPNDAKASFEHIYLRDDPRDYYSVLGSLDYAIPDLANPIFKQISAAWRSAYNRPGTILDLGSSYGINAALLRFPLTFDMLRRRYSRAEMLKLTAQQVRDLDAHYFRSWPPSSTDRIIAADVSSSAVNYAVEVGLADEGVTFNLEMDTVPRDVSATLSEVDIVISTGCVGYVTEKTFQNILAAARRPLWVVSFCLRMFEYEKIANTLTQAGLVTEKLQSAAFVQRRFRDRDEARQVLKLLRDRHVEPAGLESEGLLFAELFVSRPAKDVEAAPLEELVTVASGRNLNFGPRLIDVCKDGGDVLASVKA